MSQAVTIPAGWTSHLDRTFYDIQMERDYTRRVFEHADSGLRVFINEVQEPNSHGGWGYLVAARGADGADLGLVDDADAAEELAFEFMENYDG